MNKYRVTTKFETLYTHETESKVEYTSDFQAALGAYIIYIQNPETVFCSIDVVGANNSCKKIIAAFNTKQALPTLFLC